MTVSLGDIVGAAWMPPEGGEEGEDKEGCGEDVDGELAETSTGGSRSSGSESEGDCSEGAVKRAGPDDQGGPGANLKEEPVYTSVVSYVPPGGFLTRAMGRGAIILEAGMGKHARSQCRILIWEAATWGGRGRQDVKRWGGVDWERTWFSKARRRQDSVGVQVRRAGGWCESANRRSLGGAVTTWLQEPCWVMMKNGRWRKGGEVQKGLCAVSKMTGG